MAETKITETELSSTLLSGWIPTSETWTYASAATFTIAGVDLTTKYTKGTKIKLTNDGSVKYFYVTGSTFSTNTTVTLTGEVDLVSGAITLPNYSYADCPQGFKRAEDWYKFFGTSTQSITNASQDQVTSYSEVYDTNGDFTGGVFTAPISGVYNFSACAVINDIGIDKRIILFLVTSGGSTLAFGTANSANHDPSASVSMDMYLANGQTAYIEVFQDSGGSLSLTGSSFFCGKFVGL